MCVILQTRAYLLSRKPETESNGAGETEEREQQDGSVAAVLSDADLVANLLREAAAGAAALRAHEPAFLLSTKKKSKPPNGGDRG